MTVACAASVLAESAWRGDPSREPTVECGDRGFLRMGTGSLMRSTATASEEAALAAIVRWSGDAVIAKDVDGIVTAWNAGAALTYGYTAEQMIGQSIELTIPLEFLTEERARHLRAARGQAESGYRCVRKHADGHSVEVVMSMSPVRDENGQVTGVASISRPVSDRERSDAKVSSILEAAPDAMICVDRTGRIVLVNARVTELFGYSRDELVGELLEILLPEDLRAAHPRHRSTFFADPQPRPMGTGLGLRGRRRDGSTFPVEVSLAADRSYGITLAIAAIRDVTSQRAVEALARENETRLRQLAENVDTVFTLQQIDSHEFLYISPGFRKLTGRDPEDLIRDPGLLVNLIHPDDREGFAREYLDPCAAGYPTVFEHRIIRADGEVRWVRATARPVPNPQGEPERMVTTAEDITERMLGAQALEEAEAAARTANNAKNEFLSRMSHELRTPLNAVLGFGQLLERRLEDTPHLDSVRQILRAGRHLLNLINEVLDIARIEAGEVSLSLEPVSVASVIEETTMLMQPLAEATGVGFRLEPGADGQYVLADRQRLRQILLNLISNAVKYNKAGGYVSVGWSAVSPDAVSLSVRDDGPGIAPELHDRLFVPFDRLGAEQTGVEGTGVGLTVTRALTELMHGTIELQSGEGIGACFTVTLPSALEPDATPSPDRQDSSSRLRVGSPTTLLYVEDNEPNVRVMASLLEMRPGWRMIHAALGSLGLELARAHHPDLVLLDLHLPDGLGLQVLEAMKSDASLSQVPVVVLSADANPSVRQRLMAAGATGYITKPLDLDEMLALLDLVAAQTRSGEESS